jgi:hypothetical protein
MTIATTMLVSIPATFGKYPNPEIIPAINPVSAKTRPIL